MAYLESLTSKSGPKFRAVQSRGGKKGPSYPTETEARRWAVTQGWMEPPVSKLEDLVQEYLAARLSDEHPITIEFSRSMQAALTSVLRRREWTLVSDITLTALDRWRTQTKGRGVSRPLSYLLAVLRWGAHHRDVVVDPKVLGLKRPRQKRKVKAHDLLSDAQVRAVVKEAAKHGPHVHALIHYLATYGARPITACRLRVGDVKFAAGGEGALVVDAKHSGEWRHPLRKDTVELFAACRGERGAKDPLFLAPAEKTPEARAEGGRPMVTAEDGGWKITQEGEAEALARWYYRVIGQEVLPKRLWRIYHLKRYAITTMLERGMNPKQVAEFTGHLTASQVLEYARTSALKADQSIAMLPGSGSRTA